jgi:hypothetical protein
VGQVVHHHRRHRVLHWGRRACSLQELGGSESALWIFQPSGVGVGVLD